MPLIRYSSYINSLVNGAAGDMARPTKFTTMVEFPEYIKKAVDNKVLDVLCKTVVIPTVQMGVLEVKYRGHSVPIKGKVNFDQSLSITFYMDEGHVLRRLFVDWLNSMDKFFPYKRSIRGESLSNQISSDAGIDPRMGSLTVNAHNWEESVTMASYSFDGVYPTSVTGPEYATDGVSTAQEFTVSFAYTSYGSVDDSAYDWLGLSTDLLQVNTQNLSRLMKTDETINSPSTGNKVFETQDFFDTFNKG